MDIAAQASWRPYDIEVPTNAWGAILGIALALSLLVIAFLPAGWVGGAVARRVEQSGMGTASVVLMSIVGAVLIGLPLSGVVASLVMAIPSVAVQQVATIVAAGALVCIRLWASRRRHDTPQPDEVH